MATVAVSMIGHNNAAQLAEALESARWADEIVYVDCESGDGSPEIARRYTEKVYRRPNTTNLNVNKSYGFAQATADWIFYLDPDETIPAPLAGEIRRTIAAGPLHAAYELPRRNHYFGRWLRHGGKYPDVQRRLFRRGRAWFPCRHVHERLEVDGTVGRLAEPMNHYPVDSPHTELAKLNFYSTFNAELLARRGVRPGAVTALRYLAARPLGRFLKRYIGKAGFLDGWPGFIVATLDSLDFWLRFFKLWYYHTHPEALPPADDTGETRGPRRQEAG